MQAPTRQFRHAVSVLKKQGLLPASLSNGTKLDARSAYPDWKVKGKKLSTIIRKYDDIVSGKVTAVKPTPKNLKGFKKAGYQTTQGRVLIPHTATERVTTSRRGDVTIKSTSGIERVQIPVPYHSLGQYLRDIKKDNARINRMKRDKEYFGFRFFGFNSSQLYKEIDDAINDIEAYESVIQAFATGPKQEREVYRNLEFVKIGNPDNWVFPSERRRKMSKEYNRKRAKRFRERLERKPKHVQDRVRDESAARSKAYRARLKKNKKFSTAYKKAAKKRATKSWYNRKAKKKAVKKRKQKP